MINSKKTKSKKQNKMMIKHMKKCSFLLCILLCVYLLSGCDNIYHALSDRTEKMLNKASNAVGDKPKKAILNALNNFNKVGGESVLTSDRLLLGKRTIRNGSYYFGKYNANYDNFSGAVQLNTK